MNGDMEYKSELFMANVCSIVIHQNNAKKAKLSKNVIIIHLKCLFNCTAKLIYSHHRPVMP